MCLSQLLNSVIKDKEGSQENSSGADVNRLIHTFKQVVRG